MCISKKIFDRRGLTLLEIVLLIAVFVVGALMIPAGFKEVRERARDKTRISDMLQIQKALDTYNINTSRFPVEPEEIIINGNDRVSQKIQDEFIIEKVLMDPLHPAYTYRYISNGDGSNYELRFCLETGSVSGYKAGCENKISP